MAQQPDQRHEQSPALVLRAVDYGESDRVITLLTRDYGRISAIARAARKSKRRFAGALEGFAVIQVEYAPGRGALARLETARVTRVFPRLLTNLEGLDAAGALLRLARDLLPERAPEPDVFDCLLEALELLDAGALPRVVRMCCEARMLAMVGFAPMLQACVSCGREPSPTRLALFDAARGGIVCRACGGGLERMPARVRSLLRAAMEGQTLFEAVDGTALLDSDNAAQLGAASAAAALPAGADEAPAPPLASIGPFRVLSRGAPAALGGNLPDGVVREAERLLSLFIAQLLQREHKLHR